jgi:hypothetical protein
MYAARKECIFRYFFLRGAFAKFFGCPDPYIVVALENGSDQKQLSVFPCSSDSRDERVEQILLESCELTSPS